MKNGIVMVVLVGSISYLGSLSKDVKAEKVVKAPIEVQNKIAENDNKALHENADLDSSSLLKIDDE